MSKCHVDMARYVDMTIGPKAVFQASFLGGASAKGIMKIGGELSSKGSNLSATDLMMMIMME